MINTAVGRATPEDALMRYKKALKNLIEEGDLKLTLFDDKNGKLVEKLEALVLTASLRDKIVGESVPYRGRFRKLMADSLDGSLGNGACKHINGSCCTPQGQKGV